MRKITNDLPCSYISSHQSTVSYCLLNTSYCIKINTDIGTRNILILCERKRFEKIFKFHSLHYELILVSNR